MIYLEMSRDEVHGGPGWEFKRCIWSPINKKNGTRWAFWDKILEVRKGDTILHLRGKGKRAAFLGYSVAAGDGFQAPSRPPNPGQWSHARSFLRANLRHFKAFDQPIVLHEIFETRRQILEEYFERNDARGKSKENIFYVLQRRPSTGRRELQCLNGAYLSSIDADLYKALFDEIVSPVNGSRAVKTSVKTAQKLRLAYTRSGQDAFSDEIRTQYRSACCFPSCPVKDDKFLVGSHIARWSDCEKLRGEIGNGLCLCLMHDRAFEIGLFTLDEEFRIRVNSSLRKSTLFLRADLLAGCGQKITLAPTLPMLNALQLHWARVGFDPASWK